LLTLVDVSWQ